MQMLFKMPESPKIGGGQGEGPMHNFHPIDLEDWRSCPTWSTRVSLFLSLLCQFLISIVVERPDGREIAKPVELRVMVGDANDNRPTFPQAQYHTVVKELAARGNWWLSFSNMGLKSFL